MPGSYAEGTKSEEDTEDVSSPTVEGISPPEPINQEKVLDHVFVFILVVSRLWFCIASDTV